GIFAINFGDLFVEPYQTRTISRVWQPRSILGGAATDAAIFQLFGHMHKRATEFQIDYVKGGACSGNSKPCGRDDDCRPGGQTCEEAGLVPFVFGQLADDDRCSMFGYFSKQSDLDKLN